MEQEEAPLASVALQLSHPGTLEAVFRERSPVLGSPLLECSHLSSNPSAPACLFRSSQTYRYPHRSSLEAALPAAEGAHPSKAQQRFAGLQQPALKQTL